MLRCTSTQATPSLCGDVLFTTSGLDLLRGVSGEGGEYGLAGGNLIAAGHGAGLQAHWLWGKRQHLDADAIGRDEIPAQQALAGLPVGVG